MNRPARIMPAAPGADAVAPPEVMPWARPKRRKAKPPEAGCGAEARRTTGAPGAGEGDMTAAERELMRAMQEYKQASGRMFPTWSEVLEVVQSLGYQKPA